MAKHLLQVDGFMEAALLLAAAQSALTVPPQEVEAECQTVRTMSCGLMAEQSKQGEPSVERCL